MEHKNDPIKIGISSCLLGNHVRWDAGHRRDQFIVETLGRYFDYVPVCPEVECGLGVPRETLRLVGDWHHPRLVTTNTKIDHTERMKEWAAKRLKELEYEKLCGFIFKSESPSSGMIRVKVYPGNNVLPVKKGIGIFAKAFMDHFPKTPIEDDRRLHHSKTCENFIQQIFAIKQWQDVLSKKSR